MLKSKEGVIQIKAFANSKLQKKQAKSSLENPVTIQSIVEGMNNLNVHPGDSLVVRASISSFGYVEGGVESVIKGLLKAVGSGGSVFSLAYVKNYRLPLSKKNRRIVFDAKTPSYAGAFVNRLIEHPRSIRSRHPACSLVGIGPKAEELLPTHGPGDFAYEMLNKLAHFSNSKALLIGTIMTSPGVCTAHSAIHYLGLKRRHFGRFGLLYRDTDGSVKVFERKDSGGCSLGFKNFYDAYRDAGAVNETKIGEADCMAVNMKIALEVDLKILKEDPAYFFCDDPLCYSCRVSWGHSTTPLTVFILRRLAAKILEKKLVTRFINRN